MADNCGIYTIINIITGDYYIGSSNDVRGRIRSHRSELARNKHSNCHLQRAYNKYGADNFEFKTILLCDLENKLHYEQVLIDNMKPAYNIAITAEAPGQGLHPSDATKRKISEALKGKKPSEEHRRKISESLSGHALSEEHKHKLSEAHKGHRPSEITRCRLSDAHKGIVFSEDHRRKIGEAQRNMSDETRHKISEAKKGELNPCFGKQYSAEERAKLSEAATAYWAKRRLEAGLSG